MNRSPESIGAFSFISNISLAGVKISVGMIGHSYALIADGIESLADCISSLIVWNGVRVARREPDHDHPYGHGKAEAVAALLAGVGLIVSAGIIAVNAVRELTSPHLTPALFTVPALIAIILVKEALYRFTSRGAVHHDSGALKAEAWHHRSDSLTSLGVLVGILIAVIAGPKYAYFDDLAACVVTLLIVYNGIKIIRPALDELMDRRIEDDSQDSILSRIREVDGVIDVETLIVRRSGRDYLVDVHLEVDPGITVERGHAIAHAVRDHLFKLEAPRIRHVTTHVEPHRN